MYRLVTDTTIKTSSRCIYWYRYDPWHFLVYAGTERTTSTRLFQIPTPQEVVNNATTFIQPSSDHESNHSMTLTETLETNPWMFPNTTHLLFPFMNFTCSSNITSLMFVARLGNNLAMPVWEPGPLNLESILSTGPLFYRWHCNHGNDGHCRHYEMMEPLNLDQMYLHEVQDHTLTASHGSTDDLLGLIEMMFETSVIFNENDILGLL